MVKDAFPTKKRKACTKSNLLFSHLIVRGVRKEDKYESEHQHIC